MQMRAGREAGITHRADGTASIHCLTGAHRWGIPQVGVERLVTAVIDHHQVAVAPIVPAGELDCTISDGPYRRALRAGDVQPLVTGPVPLSNGPLSGEIIWIDGTRRRLPPFTGIVTKGLGADLTAPELQCFRDPVEDGKEASAHH